MNPSAVFIRNDYLRSRTQQNKVALISDANSGISRIAFCLREGADMFALFLNKHDDARGMRQ